MTKQQQQRQQKRSLCDSSTRSRYVIGGAIAVAIVIALAVESIMVRTSLTMILLDNVKEEEEDSAAARTPTTTTTTDTTAAVTGTVATRLPPQDEGDNLLLHHLNGSAAATTTTATVGAAATRSMENSNVTTILPTQNASTLHYYSTRSSQSNHTSTDLVPSATTTMTMTTTTTTSDNSHTGMNNRHTTAMTTNNHTTTKTPDPTTADDERLWTSLAATANDSNGDDDDDRTLLRATIVVQLGGEMCNNVAHIAHGLGLVLYLRQREGEFRRLLGDDINDDQLILKVSMVIRQQEVTKAAWARIAVQNCFPFTRQFRFDGGNGPEFHAALERQTSWLGGTTSLLDDGINAWDEATVNATLHTYIQLLLQQRQREEHQQNNNNQSLSIVSSVDDNNSLTTAAGEPALVGSNSNISSSNETVPPRPRIRVPFLLSRRMSFRDFFTDKYYDDYRRYLRFDPACCNLKPDPDETVFHHRNFQREMKRKYKRLGYEEMGPNQTARDLFGHLPAGSKVAIVTKYGKHTVEPLVRALTAAPNALRVRVVPHEEGVHDFCFLLHAHKEMIGMARSTYFMLAAILGNCTKARAYSLDSPARRRAAGGTKVYEHYNWTHPELRRRVFFELYKLDD